MATLTKPQPMTRARSAPLLDSQVPSPFPREQLEQFERVYGEDSIATPAVRREEPDMRQEAERTPEVEEEPSITIEAPTVSGTVTLVSFALSLFFCSGSHPLLERRYAVYSLRSEVLSNDFE